VISIDPEIDAVEPPATPLPTSPDVYVNTPCTSMSPVTVVVGESIVMDDEALIAAVSEFTTESLQLNRNGLGRVNSNVTGRPQPDLTLAT